MQFWYILLFFQIRKTSTDDEVGIYPKRIWPSQNLNVRKVKYNLQENTEYNQDQA